MIRGVVKHEYMIVLSSYLCTEGVDGSGETHRQRYAEHVAVHDTQRRGRQVITLQMTQETHVDDIHKVLRDEAGHQRQREIQQRVGLRARVGGHAAHAAAIALTAQHAIICGVTILVREDRRGGARGRRTLCVCVVAQVLWVRVEGCCVEVWVCAVEDQVFVDQVGGHGGLWEGECDVAVTVGTREDS